MLFKKFWMSLDANQTIYGSIKVVSSTIDQWNNGCKIMIKKCIQHIMKENLLLLKDWLESYKITKSEQNYKYMTPTSKNVYIDQSPEIVNEYNNRYHKTIKMKFDDVKLNIYIDLMRKIMIKILNLKLVTMQEYWHIKTF